MTAATTAVAVAAPPTSPVPVAAGSPWVAVVEIPNDDDDDVPPLGWDQWASAPVSAPEASAGALVAQSDAQQMTLGPRHRAPDPQRAWSRGKRRPMPRRPTSMLRWSRGSGRSSAITAPHSTGR
jgi:hypothetical protein